MNIKRINILFSLLVLLCLSTSGCGESKLFSSWRERTINIDGKYTDWSQSSAYYDERRKVVLNLVNDADYLYICLISRNRAIETKIMESGFTIWFNPDGRQKKVFGIRFPTGLRRMGISIDEEKRDIEKNWRDQEDKSGLIDRDKERLKDKNFNKRLETLEGLQDKLEIIKRDTDLKGKNKQPKPPAEEADKIGAAKDKGMAPVDFRKDRPVELTLEEARKFGIEAKVGRENDYFVYELKVPLIKSSEHLYAIEAKKGEPIGLGLEVLEYFNPKISDNAMPNEVRMPEARESMLGSPDKLKLWFIVTLSSNAT